MRFDCYFSSNLILDTSQINYVHYVRMDLLLSIKKVIELTQDCANNAVSKIHIIIGWIF